MKHIIVLLIMSTEIFAQLGEWQQFLPEYNHIPFPTDVTEIEVDRFNNKWIGTSGYDNIYGKVGGIVKFDGINWKQYTKANSKIPDGHITAIAIDKTDNCWVGMKDSGIVVIKGDSVRRIMDPYNFIEKGSVKDIVVDKTGNIWILFSSVKYFGPNYFASALMKFDGEHWYNFKLDSIGIPEEKINCLTFDSKNNLFCGSQDALIKYNGVDWEIYDAPGEDKRYSINIMEFDHRGVLWIGTDNYFSPIELFDNGVWKKNINDYEFGTPSKIIFDNLNNAWVSSSDSDIGIGKYNGNNWQYYNKTNSALLSNNINTITIDSTGILWCGTFYGACTIEGEIFRYFNSSNGLPNNFVEKVCIDEANNKWIISNPFGITKFDGATWININKSNSGIPSNEVTDLEIDKNGNIWVSTKNGIGKFDGDTWEVYNNENIGYRINNTHDIVIDQNGTVWFAAETIIYFNGINWGELNSENSGLPTNYFGRLGIDFNNNIFISSEVGFYIFDGNNWDYYNTDNSLLPNNEINCFAFDTLGNSWIGTANGLVKLNSGNWEIFSTQNSDIVGWDISDIKIDKNNNVWLGFSWEQGLVKFDGVNWQHFNTTFDNVINGLSILSINFDNFENLWIAPNYQGLIQFNKDQILTIKNNKINHDSIRFKLYPNPFNDQTNIQFELQKTSHISSKLYSITGELILEVNNGVFSEGYNVFHFNGSKLSSGVYFYNLILRPISDYPIVVITKKILLIK